MRIIAAVLLAFLLVFGTVAFEGINGGSDACDTCHWYADGSTVSQERSLGALREDIPDDQKVTVTGAAPDSWDWRNVGGTNYVTSVKNQAGCGSCVAFGTIGAFEAVIKVNGGPMTDLSEAHLFFCGGGSCDDGWYLSSALNYLETSGAPDEGCFPYQDYQMPCSDTCSDWQTRAKQIDGWGWVGGRDSIKNALVNYGPLVAQFSVYQDFFDYPDEGIWSDNIYSHKYGSLAGGHAITIVGYDNNPGGPGYWICKNSWGSAWGINGYFKMEYGECGIEDNVAYLDYHLEGNFPPDRPSRPAGPSLGDPGITYNYTTSTTDREGQQVQYQFSWDDGTITGWTSLQPSGQSITSSHTWDRVGTYHVMVRARDENGSVSGWSSSRKVYIGVQPNAPPLPPPTPSGPARGEPLTSYQFSVVTTDPDDDNIYYGWDWNGDGTADEWMGSYPSGQSITTAHTWTSGGVYTVQVKAKDVRGATSRWSDPLVVAIPPNQGPVQPSINGPTTGNTGENLKYEASTTDPERDTLYYLFDWGDGTQSGWLGPFPSGQAIHASHVWREQKSYEIKVKAKDDKGKESEWSDPLPVSVPLSFASIQEGYLHLWGKPIVPVGETILIGDTPLSVSASATPVSFWFDGHLQQTVATAPYTWSLDSPAFGWHTISVTPDDHPVSKGKTISVWFINA